MEWAKRSDADPDGKDSYFLYSVLTDASPLLYQTCRKEDTGAVVAAWSSLGEKSEWRHGLEQLLQEKGDPAGYIPILVRNLRRLPPKERVDSAALSAVSHSSHPEAVALMLEALRDPGVAEAWRREAFRHLAGTGGPEGVEAVRQARPGQGPRKAWFDRIELSKLKPPESLGMKQDARGRTWMLFHSGVLGNASDLFVVQKQGSKWGQPLFTGAWTGRTFTSQAPQAFRGIPVTRLSTTEWIRIFPDDAAIRRDTDRDGLTDLVEARLGTDPAKADTDGDGLADAVDPCPNAAPRPLGDPEKIIAACVEARFFLEDWGVPALLSAEKVKPFELYGYAGPVLWERSPRTDALGKLYGGGVNMIGFHSTNMEAPSGTPFITFGADGKTARTVIRRYSGGLNGDGIEVTLKKIGEEWFVVDLQMRYVS